jgi:cysteine sulfinate desulfinase/cysteine desulfurase-like protein
MLPIYLDYNASTPIDPAVAAAMRPFLAVASAELVSVWLAPLQLYNHSLVGHFKQHVE